MKLPAIYKDTPIFGAFPPAQENSFPLVQFFLGEDIILSVPLLLNDKPLDPAIWNLTAILKESRHSRERLWTGTVGCGIEHHTSHPGMFRVIITAADLADFKAGTYWLDILAKEHLGATNDTLDKTVIVARIPISLDYSAASAGDEKESPPGFNITRL
jgi:hypothetical protein